MVDVVHDRLGAATRQLAHEMTHGMHPADVAAEATALAANLRRLAASAAVAPEVRTQLVGLAEQADALAAVGVPPRGHQFVASAQLLLHRDDLGRNAFRAPERGGIDVPEHYRGLEPTLVAELSRVRTDLDALEPDIVDLLTAQGYFLADFFMKLTMPDLVFPVDGPREWYDAPLTPRWTSAHESVAAANANRAAAAARLEAAGKRVGLLGRVPVTRDRWWYRTVLFLVATPVMLLAFGLLAAFAVGTRTIAGWGLPSTPVLFKMPW
jgi:hypothetical protein